MRRFDWTDRVFLATALLALSIPSADDAPGWMVFTSRLFWVAVAVYLLTRAPTADKEPKL